MTYKITIPAVKINGSAPPMLPSLPDEVTLMATPDECSSNSKNFAPIDSKLFPRPAEEDAAPVPVTTMMTAATENEQEFGEFLLDAVDWL